MAPYVGSTGGMGMGVNKDQGSAWVWKFIG